MDDLMNLFNGKQTFFTAKRGFIKQQNRFSLLFGLAIIKVTPKRLALGTVTSSHMLEFSI